MPSQRTTHRAAERPAPAGHAVDHASGRTVTPVAGAGRTVAGHRFMLPVVREIAPGSGDDRRPAA